VAGVNTAGDVLHLGEGQLNVTKAEGDDDKVKEKVKEKEEEQDEVDDDNDGDVSNVDQAQALLDELQALETKIKAHGGNKAWGPDEDHLREKIKRLKAVKAEDLKIDEKNPTKSIIDICEAFLVRSTSRVSDKNLKTLCKEFIRPHEISTLPVAKQTAYHLAPAPSKEVMAMIAKKAMKKATTVAKALGKEKDTQAEQKIFLDAAKTVQKEENQAALKAEKKELKSTDMSEKGVLDSALDVKRKKQESARLDRVVKKLETKEKETEEVIKGTTKILNSKKGTAKKDLDKLEKANKKAEKIVGKGRRKL